MIEPAREFIPVRIAILTVSDTRSLADDKSGRLLANRISESGHIVAGRVVLKDDRKAISTQLMEWADHPAIDAVISTGGTGLTGRDVSVEAHRDIYEKEIDAFAVVFATVSMESIGPSAIQSRACGGVAKNTYFFALPGSPNACQDAWDKILKAQFDYCNQPCNLVEIMPRLNEHWQKK